MVSVTLTEASKLTQDDLVAGVIENIITVNQMYELVPFDGIDGNSLAYNRENVLGDVQLAAVGDTITAKNAATFTKVTSVLTTIIGDAEVNGLIQATKSQYISQEAVQVASKAKSAGRQFAQSFITGNGTSNDITGLATLVDASQIVPGSANGDNISFALLDNLLDLVIDKDGQVDYVVAHSRTVRSYKALLRSLGGANIDEQYEMPSGKRVIAYSGNPILRNDYIPINGTKGTGVATTMMFAGTFDDGSQSYGVTGITASNAAGIMVDDVGIHQSRDETITRVKWYVGAACFNLKGLAAIEGILN